MASNQHCTSKSFRLMFSPGSAALEDCLCWCSGLCSSRCCCGTLCMQQRRDVRQTCRCDAEMAQNKKLIPLQFVLCCTGISRLHMSWQVALREAVKSAAEETICPQSKTTCKDWLANRCEPVHAAQGSVALSSHQCTLLKALLGSHWQDSLNPAQSRHGSHVGCIRLQAVLGCVGD